MGEIWKEKKEEELLESLGEEEEYWWRLDERISSNDNSGLNVTAKESWQLILWLSKYLT